VPNKFPALAPDSDDAPDAVGIYLRYGGYGVHEVIIETPKHNETPVVASAHSGARQCACISGDCRGWRRTSD
jgi:galactose-1-phosphate uridylyltransferase